MTKFTPLENDKVVFENTEHVAETISHFTKPLADALCLVSELIIGSQDCEDMDDRMKLEISFYRANEIVDAIVAKDDKTLNEFYIANALLSAIDTAKKNLETDSDEEETPKIILLN